MYCKLIDKIAFLSIQVMINMGTISQGKDCHKTCLTLFFVKLMIFSHHKFSTFTIFYNKNYKYTYTIIIKKINETNLRLQIVLAFIIFHYELSITC